MIWAMKTHNQIQKHSWTFIFKMWSQYLHQNMWMCIGCCIVNNKWERRKICGRRHLQKLLPLWLKGRIVEIAKDKTEMLFRSKNNILYKLEYFAELNAQALLLTIHVHWVGRKFKMDTLYFPLLKIRLSENG